MKTKFFLIYSLDLKKGIHKKRSSFIEHCTTADCIKKRGKTLVINVRTCLQTSDIRFLLHIESVMNGVLRFVPSDA